LTEQTSSGHPLVLFDGMCKLCSGFIRYVLKLDKNNVFRFGLLQSDNVRNMLRKYEMNISGLTSIVLLEGERITVESDAVLKIARNLGGAWSLIYLFIIIPKVIRDSVYRIIARNRYRLFGKRDACMIPSSEVLDKFI
jgi:predicted DCC family thiol-disulfide oxidoreductase YuxK